MKKNALLSVIACAGMLMTVGKAQGAIIVEDTEVVQSPLCKEQYYSSARDNWFVQIGAGIQVPLLENYLPDGNARRHVTAAYGAGFGKWMTPYVGWRLSGIGGAIHWDDYRFNEAKYGSVNFDVMWDMLNSLAHVNTRRVFSIVPFVGLGGAFSWDYTGYPGNIDDNDGRKSNQWTLPVSAGIEFRFRLSNHVDFFAEGRAQFLGDNFNNTAYGNPVDVNLSAIGGIAFRFSGTRFPGHNPCNYLAYIRQLNDQVNDLRRQLTTCRSHHAAVEARQSCPDGREALADRTVGMPMLSTVTFAINSAKITDAGTVDIYNVARWMHDNPSQKVVITGYADKKTGSAEYNRLLSQRRADNVAKMLESYGIAPDRLVIQAHGSDEQPYDTNHWNRIVILSQD